MYVGAWQEFHAHKSRVNPKGATQKESVRGISKREIKKALMNSLDPNAVDKVLQAMEPLLEKFPEQSPSKEDMAAAARGPRVVDWNAPSSREKGLRYEGHTRHKKPLIQSAFRDGHGNTRGLPPLVLDKAQFNAQEFIQNQWVSQGTIAPYNRSLPSSARSHGSNATSFSSASEGMQHAGKSKDRRTRIGRVGTIQDPNRNLPRLSNLPAGVNIDGGRVSPILSVVSDVDALNRSEASPVGFHVDIMPGPNRVRDKSPGPLRAPHAPKQPPYDAQQAVNLLRLERSSRTSRGGSLRSYWKWGGDKVGGGVAAGRGDAGSAVVKPKASRVETEAERIAAVRKMQLMYMANTKAKMIAGGEATEISQAVDMSLYTAMGNAGASTRWKAGGTMTDSISSFPPTPDSRVSSTTSTGAAERGFMAPISGPLKPKTPNIRDIHLSDDDLMLVSKYFNQGLGADQRVMDGSDNDEDEHQALEASALANMERGSLPREGSRASISSDDLPGTAGTEHGLLQWTSNLDMEAIENL